MPERTAGSSLSPTCGLRDRSLTGWLLLPLLALLAMAMATTMKLEPHSSSYQPYNNDATSFWKVFKGRPWGEPTRGRGRPSVWAQRCHGKRFWQALILRSEKNFCSNFVSKWHRCAQARCAQFRGVLGGPLNLNLETLSLHFHNFTAKASKNPKKQKPSSRRPPVTVQRSPVTGQGELGTSQWGSRRLYLLSPPTLRLVLPMLNNVNLKKASFLSFFFFFSFSFLFLSLSLALSVSLFFSPFSLIVWGRQLFGSPCASSWSRSRLVDLLQ